MDDLERINLNVEIIKGRLGLYKKSKEKSKNNEGENDKRKRFYKQIISNVIKDESLLLEEIERLNKILLEINGI